MRKAAIDLTGQRFGRLLVVGRAPDQGAKVRWICVCDCGEERLVQTFNLLYGRQRSCGCYRRERAREAALRSGLGRKKN